MKIRRRVGARLFIAGGRAGGQKTEHNKTRSSF